MNRRAFLGQTTVAAGLAGVVGAVGSPAVEAAEAKATLPKIKLGIASYSYWHFKTERVRIETVIDKAAALGVEGVDILHRQMDIPEKEPLTSEHRAYLARLKQHAFRKGIDLVALSVHQDFVDPDPAFRKAQVDHTLKCIEIAYALGVPCIRLNSGRWNTIASFDDLMKAKGIEPVIPGVSEDQGFQWCAECIQQCLPKAAECGVTLALENHWGLTRTPEGLLRLLDMERGQWGQICPFDKSSSAAKALRIEGSGPWYRVVNLTLFPNFGSSGYWGGHPGVRDAVAAHGIRSSVGMLLVQMSNGQI